MKAAFVLMQKELRVYFRTFYTELTYVILFPVLLVGTMGLGLSGNEIDATGYGKVAYVLYIAPGIVLMSVVTTAFFNTGFIMLFEKEYSDAFDGVITCPIGSKEIVFGKILGGGLKSTLNGMIIIVIIFLLLGIMPPWTIWLTPFVMFLSALVFSAMGLALGVILRKGYQLGTIGNLVIFPPTFLGGIFFDVNTLPEGLSAISKASPVTMMIEASKKLMLFGDLDIALDCVVIFLTFLGFYLLAYKVFDREVFS